MIKPTCRRIYIRHADKEYANGEADIHKHDPGITPTGKERSETVAKNLIDQIGLPDLFIVSPYRRTRETAVVMNNIVKTITGKAVPVYIDAELSEYLGHHRSVPIDVTDATLIHDPPHPETFPDMKRRVRSHHDKIVNYSYNHNQNHNHNQNEPKQETDEIKQERSDHIIWIITHGLIIRQLAEFIGIKTAADFPTLTCLSIVDGKKVTRGEVIIFDLDI